MSDYETLVGVYRVVEWRDEAIYSTEFLGDRWVPYPLEAPQQGLIYGAPRSDEVPMRRRA